MNWTFLRIDLVRNLRDVANVAFVIGLPVVMLVIFGGTLGAGDDLVGRGNMQFYIMCAMAAYAGSVATTAVAGTAAVEMLQGWGRQLALTPLRPQGFVATKVVVALSVALGGVGAVLVAGLVTGAKADPPWVWWVTFAVAWLGSAVFALYGLAIAQIFRSESAVSIASASLVLFAFFGNLFVPLSGGVLEAGRWTPMYGYAGLVRYPLMQGELVRTGPGAAPTPDPLWALVLNVTAWALVFAAISVWAVRRGRRRQ